MKNRLNILQVSTADRGGGAEQVAWNLFRAYPEYGHRSWLAVRTKKTDHPNVIPLASDVFRSAWARFWLSLREKQQDSYWMDRLALIAEPTRFLKTSQGVEDFEYPATWQLLDLIPEPPDVVHCHNLHTGYFDLRILSALSRQLPVILTLHDEWLLTGHCAYALECDRWKTGCGMCPDLQIYPAIPRDATAYNWRRKKDIFADSRLYITAPCHWLLDRVQQSSVASAIVERRIIPYGIDLSNFHPSDRRAVRAKLGIPHGAKVLLFVANGIRRNPFKDYETIRAAVAQVSERMPSQEVLFIALGEDLPGERIGRITVRFVPYETDVGVVANYFQAADLYVHAAKADTFPNVVLEALACGTPVIATAVGGIPEQIKSLGNSDITISNRHSFGVEEATGVLVKPADTEAMACAIERLLKNRNLRYRLAENAANDARQRFDQKREVMEYLDWYQEIEDSATR
jgi:glycosyltransferase involved in cell wall biosynthesis